MAAVERVSAAERAERRAEIEAAAVPLIEASMADVVASSLAAMKAGKTVDEAFTAFNIAKYPGYKNERLKASIQVIYDESK